VIITIYIPLHEINVNNDNERKDARAILSESPLIK